MSKHSVKLHVVETDAPTSVTMYGWHGGELGTWTFAEWTQAIAKGDIILQPGDKFVFE